MPIIYEPRSTPEPEPEPEPPPPDEPSESRVPVQTNPPEDDDDDEEEIMHPFPEPYVGAYSWALLNLVKSIIKVTLTVVSVILYSARRMERKRNEQEELEHEWDEDDEEVIQVKRTPLLFPILICGIAVLSGVMFFSTQDMSHSMVLFDIWTIVHIVLTLITVAIFMLMSKRTAKSIAEKSNEESSEEEFEEELMHH